MAKKRYGDGGDVDYAKDVSDYVQKNQINKKITDLSVKDIPAAAKQLGVTAAGLAALPFADMASSAVNAYRRHGEQKAQKAREAENEMKRESRGIQKTETDRAREEADEMSLQRKTDKAYNDSTKGMAKGGMTASARADGIAQRGKTRGKMC